jgi:hypothetical protein
MKRIAIITAYTDKIKWDNYGKCDYGDLASMNHIAYANKHGYTYIKEIVTSEEDGWHPTWIKISILTKYLKDFDYIVWIDADAIFYNQNIKIEDLVEGDVDLVIPKLEEDRNSNKVWTHTTTGFMVWRNSTWSSSILQHMQQEPGPWKTAYFHEQTRLDEILVPFFELAGGSNILNKEKEDLKNPIILDKIKVLPYAYHRYWQDGILDYVYHAGGNTHTKLERIQKMLDQSNAR